MRSRRIFASLVSFACSLALFVSVTGCESKSKLTSKPVASSSSGTPAVSSAKTTSASAPKRGAAAHALPDPKRHVGDFAPKRSGFKFQNYGNDQGFTNLTVAEVRRMFGDQVCGSLHDGKCVLTPAAERWREASNQAMEGGHCEGFAALALLMERGQIDPELFGGETVNDLDIKANEKLQREIAYWFVTQGVMPFAEAEDKTLTPAQVADRIAAMTKGGEAYTLGIYAPGYKMGHATTPYAVVDKGNDVVWIMHYDNNYPGEEKHIVVDKRANTWSYTTAADPAAEEHAYVGDASTKTLTIAPMSVRTGPLVCHFCGAIDGSSEEDGAMRGSAQHREMREIELSGDASLLITDDAGKHLGYVGDKLVNEIPGAFFVGEKSGGARQDQPIYYVPAGKKLKVTLDGSQLTRASSSDVSLIGRGYAMAVEHVALAPGQKDEIDFAADFSKVAYTTKKPETPTLLLGVETKAADYQFEVKVTGEPGGQHVELSIDTKAGVFGVKVTSDAAKVKPSLAVELTRIDEHGAAVFKHHGTTMKHGHTALFEYASWKGAHTPVHVRIVDGKGAPVSAQDDADEN